MTYQKILLIIYYGCLVLIVAAILGGRYLTGSVHIDQFGTTGTTLSSICIIYTLAATFLAFSGFHFLLSKKKKQLRANQTGEDNDAMDNDSRLALEKYHFTISIVRMALVATAAIFCIITFFVSIRTPMTVNNNPMLWCAAIPLIMLTFCKPSEPRYRQELDN